MDSIQPINPQQHIQQVESKPDAAASAAKPLHDAAALSSILGAVHSFTKGYKKGSAPKIDPLEQWFIDHAGKNPVLGIIMYEHFISSAQMTSLNELSGTAQSDLEVQKQNDRDSYGSMA